MAEQKNYRGKQDWKIHKVIKFGIQRKIVANMTTESWKEIPHAACGIEPDVTDFWEIFQRVRKQPGWEGITINTLLLYVMTKGLIACPAMNAHINFKPWSVNGTVEEFDEVHISMPMMLPQGDMMTINIHNCESKSLADLRDYVNDVRRRMENTRLEEAMYEAAITNTMRLLKRLRINKAVGRLLGSKIGQGKIKLLKGKAKKDYYAIPKSERLHKLDIEQGTIVVSNLGSLMRTSTPATPYLIEIIPPHVAAIALGAINEKPGLIKNETGESVVAPRKFLNVNVCIDHRACDFGDFVPFFACVDEIFKNPGQIVDWLTKPANAE
ncbi:MAG: 2-oxo acid dehydrogenase subunit E2 [Oscillospiraceae bacterium]|jgi:pyruvate dehydrogenase E2 component (dihydrolipoamide acetyltransferase)|nr:2-oxo acid dehydrogenase subunit E2 [Oscillospiraceae bacterium]